MDKKFLLACTLKKDYNPFKLRKFIEKENFSESPFFENLPFHYAEKILENAEKKNNWIITIKEEDYPESLKAIEDAPLVLYGKGEKKNLKELCFAVIGTRKPTEYGRKYAKFFAGELAENGICIISGGARGIDTIAHRAALEAQGKTICVLGSGLDFPYPPENKKLFEEIAQKGGSVISEYPFGTKPMKFHFPMRNRIISGISRGILVIEARDKSGTFTTVKSALSYGKEVYAIPGSLDSKTSKGTNFMIKEGAHCVLDPCDILDDLGIKKKIKDKRALNLNEDEKRVYEILKDSSMNIEEIAEKMDYPPSLLLSILFTLEMKGYIEQTPGKRFRRKL